MRIITEEDKQRTSYYENRDGYVEDPYGSTHRRPCAYLNLVSQEKFDKLKAEGELYEISDMGEMEDDEQRLRMIESFGGEPQSLVYMETMGDNTSRLQKEIVRAIARRWHGAYFYDYYSGDETDPLPEREDPTFIPTLADFPQDPQPPKSSMEEDNSWEGAGDCNDLVYFSVDIEVDEFLDVMRGYPGMFVPDAAYTREHELRYHAYLGFPDHAGCSLFFRFNLWEGSSPEAEEVLGAPSRCYLEIRRGWGECDMILHQVVNALFEHWPGAYETAISSSYIKVFTPDEVRKGVRCGVHAFYVNRIPKRLPPETHEEIHAVPRPLPVPDFDDLLTKFELTETLLERPDIQFKLGTVYELTADRKGGGVPYRKSAFDWYQKAADGGHLGAQVRLALLYHAGFKGVIEKNSERVVFWLYKAAERGDPAALKIIARLRKQGAELPDIPRPKVIVRDALTEDLFSWLGMREFYGGPDDDDEVPSPKPKLKLKPKHEKVRKIEIEPDDFSAKAMPP
ncbi:MAG TPA: tetratricopeptide repeat protein [Candidatus Baltobacteraceae bacterium]|nr:tetratricopeptide repeat protein [Candidatus Baltobacteraceae bacterium]